MLVGCIYGIATNGLANWNSPALKKFEFSQIHFVFGNAIFINIFQTSISGTFHPMRPQIAIRSTIFWCVIITMSILTLEGVLAVMAFGSLTAEGPNPCDTFPCPIQVPNMLCGYIYIYICIFINI